MKILTGCWSCHFPSDHVRIGISRGSPKWLKPGPRIPELAPGTWFYTVTDDAELFRSKYVGQLECVDPGEVVERIDRLAGGRTAVLTCFCKPGDGRWCHRSWVSVWLAHHLGLVVEEYGFEGQGFAAEHVMLPAEFRRPLRTAVVPAKPRQLDLL